MTLRILRRSTKFVDHKPADPAPFDEQPCRANLASRTLAVAAHRREVAVARAKSFGEAGLNALHKHLPGAFMLGTSSVPEFTERQRQAIQDYRAFTVHGPLNTALRAGKALEQEPLVRWANGREVDIAEVAAGLEECFDLVPPLTQESVVWRGETLNDKELADLLQQVDSGGMLARGYSSTAKTEEGAKDFIKYSASKADNTVLFTIKVPKGSKVLEIKGVEQEVLLRQSSHFKIVSMQELERSDAVEAGYAKMSSEYAEHVRLDARGKRHFEIELEYLPH